MEQNEYIKSSLEIGGLFKAEMAERIFYKIYEQIEDIDKCVEKANKAAKEIFDKSFK